MNSRNRTGGNFAVTANTGGGGGFDDILSGGSGIAIIRYPHSGTIDHLAQ
jgi:hypothetical protein